MCGTNEKVEYLWQGSGTTGLFLGKPVGADDVAPRSTRSAQFSGGRRLSGHKAGHLNPYWRMF